MNLTEVSRSQTLAQIQRGADPRYNIAVIDAKKKRVGDSVVGTGKYFAEMMSVSDAMRRDCWTMMAGQTEERRGVYSEVVRVQWCGCPECILQDGGGCYTPSRHSNGARTGHGASHNLGKNDECSAWIAESSDGRAAGCQWLALKTAWRWDPAIQTTRRCDLTGGMEQLSSARRLRGALVQECDVLH